MIPLAIVFTVVQSTMHEPRFVCGLREEQAGNASECVGVQYVQQYARVLPSIIRFVIYFNDQRFLSSQV